MIVATVFALLFVSALSKNVSFPTNYYGVDVSQPTSESAFRCLVGDNLLFAVVRCYMSVGRPDPNCASTTRNARAAGMKVVDGYFFPCPTCGASADAQMGQMLSYFEQNRVDIDVLWLDIEGTQYWTGSAARNQAWYRSLVDAALNRGLKIGVYSSYYQWEEIFGTLSFSYKAGSMPIWYAHYDGIPGFSDWRSFGGWGSPSCKQFSDQGGKCGASYDINWRPSL